MSQVNNALNNVQGQVAAMTAPKKQAAPAFLGSVDKPEGGCKTCSGCGACGKNATQGKALDIRG